MERTDEDDIDATRCERAALSCPAETVLENPRVEVVLCVLCEAQRGVSNTLEDVVVVFGGSEHRWRWVWHIPKSQGVNTETQKTTHVLSR